MVKNRVSKFILIMLVLMAAAQFYLAGRGNINMMPAVLVVFAIITLVLRTGGDSLLNIMLAYGMSHFHFATKAGMLGPWLILTIFLIQGVRFVSARIRLVDRSLLPYVIVFLIVNLLGLVYKNPNSIIENITSYISLIGLMVTLLASSQVEVSRENLKFVIQVFGIMTLYTCFSSLNTSLAIIKTSSPLLTLHESYFGSSFGVAMFGRSYSEYFLCMNLFFANLLTIDTIKHYGINKNLVVLFYLSSFLGCILGFSKTMTVLLIIGNTLVFARMKFMNNYRSVFRVFATIGVLILVLVIAQQFINLEYIFDRFAQQPEIFQRVWEAPLTAEGTSRDVSFYWGWRRNLDFNWLLGYGWSPADANNSAYFHDLPINTGKHDFHNLYLSIFPVFGWIGGGIFLIWLVSCLLKALKVSKKAKDSGLRTFGSGMMWLIIVFMLGEYALPVTTEANYFFVLIVWMGLVNSLFTGINTNVVVYESNSLLNSRKVIEHTGVIS